MTMICEFSTLQNTRSITCNPCISVGAVFPSATLCVFEVRISFYSFYVDLPKLVELETGPDVFRNTQTCLIHNLPELVRVTIGLSSFTKSNSQPQQVSGKMEIVNCKSLRTVEVRDSSFISFGELKLENLPSLNSLVFKRHSFMNSLKLQIAGMNGK